MKRTICASVSLILSIGLVGCAANNPTRDTDVVRDRSVEDRIRDGEALSTSREAAERSAQRQKDTSTTYGGQPGIGGSRKTTPGTTRTGTDVDADEKDPTAPTDTSGSLAALLGKSSGGGSGWGMWLAAGASALIAGGGKLAGYLTGGKEKDSKDSKDPKDLKTADASAAASSGSGANLRGPVASNNAGGVVTTGAQSTTTPPVQPMKPEGTRPSGENRGAADVANTLRVQVPLTATAPNQQGEAPQANPEVKPPTEPAAAAPVTAAPVADSNVLIQFKDDDGVWLIDENGVVSSGSILLTSNAVETNIVSDTPNVDCVLPSDPIHPDLANVYNAMKKRGAL